MKKVLIIDDDWKFTQALTEYFLVDGVIVDRRHTVEDGRDCVAANNDYDVIFIDLQFNNEKKDNEGAQLGLKIRKLSPLSALILVTAWGEERISDFIFVGFDNYQAKYEEGEGSDFDRMLSELDDCIDKAISNSQIRIKTKFTPGELEETRKILDYIKQTVAFLIDNKMEMNMNGQMIVGGVLLLKRGKPLDIDILRNLKNKDKETVKKTIKDHELAEYNYLTGELQIKNQDGEYNVNALKVRQLLTESDEWDLILGKKRNGTFYYKPIYRICNEFKIKQSILNPTSHA